MPPPPRAHTLPAHANQPTRSETVKPHGIMRMFTHHNSNMSLPRHQDSLQSSLESDAEQHTSYILKGIDMFAPRPTIHYQQPSHHAEKAAAQQSRVDLFEAENFTDGNPKSRKRIDDLADDLDAHDLRELMDRDRRRRERKKVLDQEKMARKLAAKRKKRDIEAAEAVLEGREPPKNTDRGVLGREISSPRIEVPTLNQAIRDEPADDPFTDAHQVRDLESPSERPAVSPFEFVRSASLPGTEPTSPTDDREEPIIAVAQVARLSRANMSPPASPRQVQGHKRNRSSMSQLQDLPPSKLQAPPVPAKDASISESLKPEQPNRRSSETGSSANHSSWKTWFKRNSKERRSSAQSSFSNTTRDTTRDSLVVTPQPPISYTPNPLLKGSGVPKRTMSRFREDLPELPISPPASRLQSPEAPVRPARPEGLNLSGIGVQLRDAPSPFARYETPTHNFDGASSIRNETPSDRRRSIDNVSPDLNLLSQSLASIDSEGSWLSGRPRTDSKRSSAQRSSMRSSMQAPHRPRDSHGSLQKRHREFSDSAEDLGIAEDEYYNRLTPGPDDMYSKTNMQNRQSGNPMASSDEEDGHLANPRARKEGTWGDVSRKPTVVRRVQRTDSAQGVLVDIQGGSDDDGSVYRPQTPRNQSVDESDFTGSPTSPNEVLQRATSIDYKKAHMRHISAGSAKLLDLKPRGSTDSRRKSGAFQ